MRVHILLQSPSTSPTPEELAAVVQAMFVFLVVYAIVVIVLSIWIYRSAGRRGDSQILWLTLMLGGSPILVAGPIATVISFLILRKPKGGPAPKLPPPPTTGSPAPALPAGIPSNVRCPRCKTVFAFEKNPRGPSRLKCPSCGLEGTL